MLPVPNGTNLRQPVLAVFQPTRGRHTDWLSGHELLEGKRGQTNSFLIINGNR